MCQARQLRGGDWVLPLWRQSAPLLTLRAQLTSWSTLETTNSAVAGLAKAEAALEAIFALALQAQGAARPIPLQPEAQ